VQQHCQCSSCDSLERGADQSVSLSWLSVPKRLLLAGVVLTPLVLYPLLNLKFFDCQTWASSRRLRKAHIEAPNRMPGLPGSEVYNTRPEWREQLNALPTLQQTGGSIPSIFLAHGRPSALLHFIHFVVTNISNLFRTDVDMAGSCANGKFAYVANGRLARP
jgi:hypothetical protein